MSAGVTFRALHGGPGALRLANAWDSLSARLVEESGGRAVATSSAGLAWAQGFTDHERLPLDRLLNSAGDLVARVRVPVSLDLERGYSEQPERVAELVVRLAELGVAGVNLEDAGEPSEGLARKLEACRRALAAAGLDSFLNARCDCHFGAHAAIGTAAERTVQTVLRGQRYRDAGADGLFVPGLFEPAAIRHIASEVPLPLNVWWLAERGSVAELEALGVRRVSVGPRVLLTALRAAYAEMLTVHGAAPAAGAWDYARVDALFSRDA